MIETAKKAALAAGKIIKEKFDTEVIFKEKHDKSFVSVVDETSEQEILRIIKEKYPDHSFNGEETGTSGKHEYIWHIDPLDGTTNYRNKFRAAAVSIGLTKKDEFVLGVIYHPFTGELFYAEKDKGAYCNGNKLSVANDNLKEGLVFIDGSFGRGRGEYKIKFQEKLLEHAGRFRIIGSTVVQMVQVAKGTAVLSISDAVKTYDFAAATVIIREAGGIVTDQFGNNIKVDSKVIVACNNKENHDKIIAITKEVYKDYNI